MSSGAFLVMGVLLAAIVLQLFAVPGSGFVPLGHIVALLLVGWALVTGHLLISAPRCCMYLAVIAALAVTLFFKWLPFSLLSLSMLILIYAPFVAIARTTRAGYLQIVDVHQRVAMFIAICGIGQFSAQFLIGGEWMFPLQQVLPTQFLIPDYNLRIPIGDDGTIFKSTGIWLLEPSLLSQAMALAILIEVSYFRRPQVLLLLGAACVLAFSGTGFLLLGIVAVPLLVRLRQFWPLALACAGIALFLMLLPVLRDVPPFSFFLERMSEFANPLSSASMRFFAPYWLTRDIILADPAILWFGLGPGSFKAAIDLPDYATQDTAWLKLLLEYGLIGAVPLSVFYLYVLFRHSPDKLLSFAFLVQILFLGGYLNSYFIQFLMLVLVGWPRLIERDVLANRQERFQ